MQKMSSLTFPDGSSYEVTDDKARKDITEINNDIDNVQGAIDELKGTIGYSKKNLLKNTATSHTKNGVTFTVNSDGSITVNGTPTGEEVTLELCNTQIKNLPNGEYIVSGAKDGIEFRVVADGWGLGGCGGDNGNEFKFTIDDTYSTNWIRLRIKKGVNANNVTVYPMVRLASISDNTYEPYVDDVQTQLDLLNKYTINEGNGHSEYRYVYQVLGSESNNKPWLELKAQWDKFENRVSYNGLIYSGSVYHFVGYKIWDNYGSFFLTNYGAIYHVFVSNGTWTLRTVNESNSQTF